MQDERGRRRDLVVVAFWWKKFGREPTCFPVSLLVVNKRAEKGREKEGFFFFLTAFPREKRRAGTRVFVCENVYMTLNVACTSQGGGWMGTWGRKIYDYSPLCKVWAFFFLFVQRNFGNITALVPLAIIAEVILYRG